MLCQLAQCLVNKGDDLRYDWWPSNCNLCPLVVKWLIGSHTVSWFAVIEILWVSKWLFSATYTLCSMLGCSHQFTSSAVYSHSIGWFLVNDDLQHVWLAESIVRCVCTAPLGQAKLIYRSLSKLFQKCMQMRGHAFSLFITTFWNKFNESHSKFVRVWKLIKNRSKKGIMNLRQYCLKWCGQCCKSILPGLAIMVKYRLTIWIIKPYSLPVW